MQAVGLACRSEARTNHTLTLGNNNCASTITEQNAKATIIPIHHTRRLLGCHHQDILCLAALQAVISHIQCIYKTRASSVYIHTSTLCADGTLHDAAQARRDVLIHYIRTNDIVDIRRLQTRISDSLQRRLGSQILQLLRRDNATLRHTCTRLDPLVAGVEELLKHSICYNLGRMGPAGSNNLHSLNSFQKTTFSFYQSIRFGAYPSRSQKYLKAASNKQMCGRKHLFVTKRTFLVAKSDVF